MERCAVLCDIDGVLRRGSKAIPGAARFVRALQRSGRRYLFLTNSPDNSPRELSASLRRLGMDVPAEHFYTSAQAIGAFIERQHGRGARVFLIGSPALRQELARIGAVFVDRRADYVILCSGGRYDKTQLDTALSLVLDGARFVTANREPASPSEDGVTTGCGALVAPIEKVVKCPAYVAGKPNHLMIRAAESMLGLEPTHTLVIGDSLDTDVDVGIQAQMKTVLVLSGITDRDALERSPFKPDWVFPSVAKIDLSRLP